MGETASHFELALTRVPGVRLHLSEEVEHLFFTDVYLPLYLFASLERRVKYVNRELRSQ